ncbi:pentapeptide repeat-containing protein [Nocardiopsis alba]|uniref:pentapeptide repeat-containing protein n=1 Tax=Nocardiopsis alba TaxID=53437 RepID=UPI0035DF1CCC
MWVVLGVPELETNTTVSPKVLDALAARALGVVAGLGGVALIVISYQRQNGEKKRLFAERYATAVAQLGDESPAVRLGGVYSLASLADDAPDPGLRQTCVGVLCSYLRTPVPDSLPQGSSEEQQYDHHARVVEHASMREVRLAIVRTISQRLRTPSPWRECDFDFSRVVFEGEAGFESAVFNGRADFSGAVFEERVWFQEAIFSGGANFEKARFSSDVEFGAVKFLWDAIFVDVEFGKRSGFRDATFGGFAEFSGVRFGADVDFWGAKFAVGPGFSKSEFEGKARFCGVDFGGGMIFDRAIFVRNAVFRRSVAGGADFSEAIFGEESDFSDVRFLGMSFFEDVDFIGLSYFQDASFLGGAEFRSSHEFEVDGSVGGCPEGLYEASMSSSGMVSLPLKWLISKSDNHRHSSRGDGVE